MHVLHERPPLRPLALKFQNAPLLGFDLAPQNCRTKGRPEFYMYILSLALYPTI